MDCCVAKANRKHSTFETIIGGEQNRAQYILEDLRDVENLVEWFIWIG
jgi:hypothetical protein